MNITIKQLKAFITVAQTGSFTLAAEKLDTTQSALSAQIKDLESALELKILDRSTRHAYLSEVGQNLYPLVNKVLQALDETCIEVNKIKELQTGVVRVAMPQSFAATVFPKVTAAYCATHQNIHIKPVDTFFEAIPSMVYSGEVDFGITLDQSLNSDLDTKPLFTATITVVFPQGHPLEKHAEVKWADLVEYPWIALRHPSIQNVLKEVKHLSTNKNITLAGEVEFMTTSLGMVSAGMGVGFGSPYADSLLKLYKLETRPLVGPVISRQFNVITRRLYSTTPSAQSFMDFLFDYVKRNPEYFR